MFLQFFTSLRDAQVPVTLREYLTLMEAIDADLAEQTVENFYYLARASLVKDERNLDKFDRVFGTVFKGLESLLDAMEKADIPAEWLKKLAEKYLTEEEKKQIEAMGWDKLMETLRQRLKEQKGRHQGGNKWIGTAGTSPFGAEGYNPEGMHIEQVEELFSAAKTEFKHMEYFYFHNCLYEGVWKQNRRRFTDRTPTWDVLHKYPHDYKVVFVGDASMSPYEIMVPGGSVEHVNEEAGSVWLERITRTYPHAVWLNPVAQRHWDYSESTTLIRRLCF